MGEGGHPAALEPHPTHRGRHARAERSDEHGLSFDPGRRLQRALQRFRRARLRPEVGRQPGVIDNLIPTTLSTHQVLVPAVDGIGNEIAGVRVPAVAAPLATLTGWHLRASQVADGDLCDLVGSTIPLYVTQAERLTAGDSRPSLEELYGSHDGYVRAVAMAAHALRSERLLLTEDVDRIIAEAEQSDVLRSLAPSPQM